MDEFVVLVKVHFRYDPPELYGIFKDPYDEVKKMVDQCNSLLVKEYLEQLENAKFLYDEGAKELIRERLKESVAAKYENINVLEYFLSTEEYHYSYLSRSGDKYSKLEIFE